MAHIQRFLRPAEDHWGTISRRIRAHAGAKIADFCARIETRHVWRKIHPRAGAGRSSEAASAPRASAHVPILKTLPILQHADSHSPTIFRCLRDSAIAKPTNFDTEKRASKNAANQRAASNLQEEPPGRKQRQQKVEEWGNLLLGSLCSLLFKNSPRKLPGTSRREFWQPWKKPREKRHFGPHRVLANCGKTQTVPSEQGAAKSNSGVLQNGATVAAGGPEMQEWQAKKSAKTRSGPIEKAQLSP